MTVRTSLWHGIERTGVASCPRPFTFAKTGGLVSAGQFAQNSFAHITKFFKSGATVALTPALLQASSQIAGHLGGASALPFFFKTKHVSQSQLQNSSSRKREGNWSAFENVQKELAGG